MPFTFATSEDSRDPIESFSDDDDDEDEVIPIPHPGPGKRKQALGGRDPGRRPTTRRPVVDKVGRTRAGTPLPGGKENRPPESSTSRITLYVNREKREKGGMELKFMKDQSRRDLWPESSTTARQTPSE